MIKQHLLSLIIFLPLLGALLVSLFPRAEKGLMRNFAFVFSLIPFFLSVLLFSRFDAGLHDFQFVESSPWIGMGIRYFVGVDGISLLLVVLTTFITPITILSAYKSIEERVKQFLISMFLLETGMLGAFLSLDMFVFYIFWEFMLIPMYFIIGVWGGERRIYAAVKFFIYTMVGSVLMLVAIIYMYIKASGSFSYESFLNLSLSVKEQLFLFLAFGLAFAIKVPVFPFHTWLPDAHVEAPTPGSVILAGILLKLGTYGFLRFALPFFPQAFEFFRIPIIVLAIIGIIYGAMVAFAQKDIKKLVAYSSVSHLGFVMLGIFALTFESVEGAILQMVNHGISTGALFLLVGIIYERRHTRLISEYGGIAKVVPAYAVIFMIITLSSIGLPGTNGFIGEFLILAGAVKSGVSEISTLSGKIVLTMSILAATGIILGAIYMLTMYRRVFHGEVTNEKNRSLKDLNLREYFVLIPMVIMVFAIGIFPDLFLSKVHKSVKNYVSKHGRNQVVRNITIKSEHNKKFSNIFVINNENMINSKKR